MSNDQKIPGVPEGWRLVHVNVYVSDHVGVIVRGEAVLERIPKPKKTVLIAEWDLSPAAEVTNPRAVLTRNGELIDYSRWPDRTRIEERDV